MSTKILFLFIAALFVVEIATSQTIILTSDDQLDKLMDPDQKIDMSLGHNATFHSLREVCENGKKQGSSQLTIAFDEFFRQYRPQAGTERLLTPDMDEYVRKIKVISDFAKNYGLGLQLSLLSPLELGYAYKKQTGEAGRWLDYKVGLRNPSDGKFSISIWQQLFWTNNKGRFKLKLKGVKAYAFKQKTINNSPYRAVDPDDIIEIEGVQYESGDTLDVGGGTYGIKKSSKDMIFPARNIRVYYDGPKQLQGYDRVFVLLEYESPELDYFSDKAPVFLRNLMRKYKDNGINLTALYSDEMHIQQDWAYFSHHEGGQFATRYLTKNFSEKYKEKFKQPLGDKYLLYFVYGAPYYLAQASAVRNVQYVLGESPKDIHRTFLLRDRYYKMLNNQVVNLFNDAKKYTENLFGRDLPTGAHASWAESPTIDLWDTEKLHENAYKYEYTSNFVWSNTVQQAAAACYDYFKWGEYLIPTGNDFAETGWGDRDYYGAAMGASIGVINQSRNAYAAAWGFPKEALQWKNRLNDAYGDRASKPIRLMTNNVHRDIEVLMIYPMNLVAVEERFGSWMTQYGYANYLTSSKLVEMGEVLPDGRLQVADKYYSTVVVLFEPLPEVGLLDKLRDFAEKGGNVVWLSAPPLLNNDGQDCTKEWQGIFGAAYHYDTYMGEIAAGKEIEFSNKLQAVSSQPILTDFLVDRIYPVTENPLKGQVVAKVDDQVVGTKHKIGEGYAYYLGFRPRDDQSKSLGYESRTMFDILDQIGAYPPTRNSSENDNPTYVSRTTDFLVTKFPNETVAIVKHYRTHRENWEGGFSRDEEADRRALSVNPLPSDTLKIDKLRVNGHSISYHGKMNIAYRLNKGGELIAFDGRNCRGITVDERTYTFSKEPMDISFIPTDEDFLSFQIKITGEGEIRLPIVANRKSVTVKDGENLIPSEVNGNNLIVEIDNKLSGKWLDVHLN